MKVCVENSLISDKNANIFHSSIKDRTIEFQNKGYEVAYSFTTAVDLENNLWYSCLVSGYIVK